MMNTAAQIIATQGLAALEMAESSFSIDDAKEEEQPLAAFRLNV